MRRLVPCNNLPRLLHLSFHDQIPRRLGTQHIDQHTHQAREDGLDHKRNAPLPVALPARQHHHDPQHQQRPDLEARAKDTHDAAPQVHGGHLGDVLRRRAQRGPEAQDEPAGHEGREVGRRALHEGSHDGEEVSRKVDAPPADHVAEGQEGGADERADLHEGVDGADNHTGGRKAVVGVPAVKGVDAADDAPVDAIAGLVEAHDHHEAADAQAGPRVDGQGGAGLAKEVFLGDAVGHHFADGDAELGGFGDVVEVGVVFVCVCHVEVDVKVEPLWTSARSVRGAGRLIYSQAQPFTPQSPGRHAMHL